MTKIRYTSYAFEIDALPPAFQDEIKKYNLGRDGYWTTIAEGPEEAQLQVADFIRVVTGEKINPCRLSCKLAPKKSKMGVKKWNGSPAKRILKVSA